MDAQRRRCPDRAIERLEVGGVLRVKCHERRRLRAGEDPPLVHLSAAGNRGPVDARRRAALSVRAKPVDLELDGSGLADLMQRLPRPREAAPTPPPSTDAGPLALTGSSRGSTRSSPPGGAEARESGGRAGRRPSKRRPRERVGHGGASGSRARPVPGERPRCEPGAQAEGGAPRRRAEAGSLGEGGSPAGRRRPRRSAAARSPLRSPLPSPPTRPRRTRRRRVATSAKPATISDGEPNETPASASNAPRRPTQRHMLDWRACVAHRCSAAR